MWCIATTRCIPAVLHRRLLVGVCSSLGPSLTLDLKPGVAAPGAGILSTWPLALGSYAVISGTSAAAPHAAGAAALIIQARNGAHDAPYCNTFACLHWCWHALALSDM